MEQVCIWLVREDVGDFRISVRATSYGEYRVGITEQDERDSYKIEHVFQTYETASRYIDILIGQALTDRDSAHPFTHFQYSVPFFPTIIMPIQNIGRKDVYKVFASAVDFYFTNE
jgi:hypothetical protein